MGRLGAGAADRDPRCPLLGRDVCPRPRARPRGGGGLAAPISARSCGPRAAASPSTMPSRWNGSAPRRQAAPCRTCCSRPMPGWSAFPIVDLSADETAAIAKGQFVRPAAPLPDLPARRALPAPRPRRAARRRRGAARRPARTGEGPDRRRRIDDGEAAAGARAGRAREPAHAAAARRCPVGCGWCPDCPG